MILLASLLGAACAPHSERTKLKIAAAADLNFAMEEVAREFGKTHPAIELEMAYGSSGNFYAQIRNGAPFDLFLSADMEYPRKLAQERLAPADSLFTYAVGRIVVWVPANSALDPANALRAAAVRHVAIANPQHAPYGRAAVAAMRRLGVYDSVE
ncbi:MAG TPA: molybdate ABC transporter substrate-binding protein, partial [Bryobacteraceae bacterium]